MTQLFCRKPFTWFEPAAAGEVFLCCPSWLPKSVGNLSARSIDELWNGEEAQAIRHSILDGSFRFCRAERCPWLQTSSGPVSRVADLEPEFREIVSRRLTVLQHGPRQLNCAYDRSCNLSCPSCRSEVIVENESQILALQHKIEGGALRDAERLYITGSGDPFGGPYFRRWLRTMQRSDVPSLREIHLHTNALLWTRENWQAIAEEIRALVTSTHISIDAATAETYAVNRRGGEFSLLLENLDFISELRRRGPLAHVTISMVVQANNFREMPAFVELCRRFGFDRAVFNRLVDWGTFSGDEFRRRAICESAHPDHAELLSLLAHEALSRPPASLGNLTNLTASE